MIDRPSAGSRLIRASLQPVGNSFLRREMGDSDGCRGDRDSAKPFPFSAEREGRRRRVAPPPQRSPQSRRRARPGPTPSGAATSSRHVTSAVRTNFPGVDVMLGVISERNSIHSRTEQFIQKLYSKYYYITSYDYYSGKKIRNHPYKNNQRGL